MKRFLALSLVAAAFVFGSISREANAAAPTTLPPPRIVATQNYANETGAISETLYAPSVSGTFRVSVYVEVFGADDNSAVNPSLGWTDDGGQKPGATDPPLVVSVSDSSYGEGVFTVHSVAATPITLSVNSPTLPTGASYTIFAVVEKI